MYLQCPKIWYYISLRVYNQRLKWTKLNSSWKGWVLLSLHLNLLTSLRYQSSRLPHNIMELKLHHQNKSPLNRDMESAQYLEDAYRTRNGSFNDNLIERHWTSIIIGLKEFSRWKHFPCSISTPPPPLPPLFGSSLRRWKSYWYAYHEDPAIHRNSYMIWISIVFFSTMGTGQFIMTSLAPLWKNNQKSLSLVCLNSMAWLIPSSIVE